VVEGTGLENSQVSFFRSLAVPYPHPQSLYIKASAREPAERLDPTQLLVQLLPHAPKGALSPFVASSWWGGCELLGNPSAIECAAPSFHSRGSLACRQIPESN
jgi:hypothetical protein